MGDKNVTYLCSKIISTLLNIIVVLQNRGFYFQEGKWAMMSETISVLLWFLSKSTFSLIEWIYVSAPKSLHRSRSGDIFEEQKMRSELALGRLAILKKWGRLRATFEGSFFMFSGAKKLLIFLKKRCSVRTKKLHKMKLKMIIFDTWKKKYLN